MISANNISLAYGSQVLFKDVNLKFSPEECYGIIGANVPEDPERGDRA